HTSTHGNSTLPLHDALPISFDEIRKLFLNKDGNKLVSDQMIPFEEINSRIWNLGAQIFTPCAASRLVTREQVDAMVASGLEVISDRKSTRLNSSHVKISYAV